MASENPPGRSNAKIYIFRPMGDILGDTVYFSEAYMDNYLLRVGLWGKSDGNYAGFESYRGKNGVAVKDGELILWGMKAMP